MTFPPSPLRNWEEDFLVEYQMQLRRTNEENETCNYLDCKSSGQIALIPPDFVLLSYFIFSPTGVQIVWTGAGKRHSDPTG